MKVILRELQESDAAISYKWRNDPDIWKYTGSKPDKYITPEMEREWIISVLKRKDQKRFAICINEEQQYIGNIQLTDITNNSAQVHIFIGEKKYWGQGIAVEAIRLIINYGFNTLNLPNIFLLVHKDNIPAIRAYLKCGFVKNESEENTLKMVIINEH